MTARVYAVGDIHGQLDALAEAHALIAADAARTGEDAPVVHLGDLVDRGPESAEVVEYLRMGPARGGPWIVLRGNHDLMFRLFLDDHRTRDPGLSERHTWLDPELGGRATLRSYGVDASPDRPAGDIWAEAQARVPAAHRVFLDNRPLLWRTEAAVFVHAGIRPGVPLILQEPQDLLWIRRGFLEDGRDHGVLVVHGHTALPAPRHHGNRVNLDGGAGYGRPLRPAVIEGRDVFLLTEDGRQPLLPEG
ncbi:metallophosphoesterase [Rubellimicrobium sp. CFH 75288]|uniref:metallophosphoesterase n=1 Tax=Rubellimicrobium sp. CFH 75288 TaxID=2697034 RepID=UPI001412672C|nr:serine/threonine protein phosphatase [Rubellimicrobium sp. CFH 75288]